MGENSDDYRYENPSSALTTFPSKKQAIVIFTIEGVPLKKYIESLSKIVPLSTIVYANRIPGDHIGVILSSESVVDEIMNNHPFINIENEKIRISRFIDPPQKIIFDCVHPFIPNEMLLKALNDINITITSPVSLVRHQELRYRHILTFKRKVYIKSNDISKIPEYITITHNNKTFKIRISFTDK